MKIPTRQRIWLCVLLLGNVVLWLVPSDVVELIARDQHTLLGRYSRTHFVWNLALGIFLLVNAYTDLAVGATRRRRQFQVFAILMAGAPAILALDFALRQRHGAHYIYDHIAYHRPANVTFSLDAVDRPEALRTYPNAPPGHATVKCTYRTDQRGYRNQTDLDTYDIVVLGDSFAEGSRVSDEHPWPVGLAERTGLSVYNLGMSGYNPHRYAASLERFGLALKPKIVLCLLYEGNDFRSRESVEHSRRRPTFAKRFKTYTKRSPILMAIDRVLLGVLEPIGSLGPVAGVDDLDWLPLTIPLQGQTHYYAFAPKQLRDLYQESKAFEGGRYWRSAREHLVWMRDVCENNSTRFVVVYAPTVAHVTLPLVADHLPAEKVARFTAISHDKPLPAPEVFLGNLSERMDGQESTLRRWCAKEGVPFVTLTHGLREAAASGTQVYYTYDQHWTPSGHRVVAEIVAEFISDAMVTGGPNSSKAEEVRRRMREYGMENFLTAP